MTFRGGGGSVGTPCSIPYGRSYAAGGFCGIPLPGGCMPPPAPVLCGAVGLPCVATSWVTLPLAAFGPSPPGNIDSIGDQDSSTVVLTRGCNPHQSFHTPRPMIKLHSKPSLNSCRKCARST